MSIFGADGGPNKVYVLCLEPTPKKSLCALPGGRPGPIPRTRAYGQDGKTKPEGNLTHYLGACDHQVPYPNGLAAKPSKPFKHPAPESPTGKHANEV